MCKVDDLSKKWFKYILFLDDAITNAVNNLSPLLGQIASEHIDLDHGLNGRNNEGVYWSIIYKGGNKIEGLFDGFETLLLGLQAGAENLRQMPKIEFEE